MNRIARTIGLILLTVWTIAAGPLEPDAAGPSGPGAAGPSGAGAWVSDEKEIVALENRWTAAIMQGDTAALAAILDNRFVDVTWTGRFRDRDAALATLSSPDRAKTEQRLEDLRVRFAVKDVAVVTGVNAVTGHDPAFAVRVHFTDVFVRTSLGWKAFSAQETLEKPE